MRRVIATWPGFLISLERNPLSSSKKHGRQGSWVLKKKGLVKSGSSQGAQAATFLFFPAIFLAPTFVPREQLKGWLETAAAYNPTTYVIEGMRSVMVQGWELDILFRGFLAATSFAVITLTLAVISARKATEKA